MAGRPGKTGKPGRPKKKPGEPKSKYNYSLKAMERDKIIPMDGEAAEYNRRLIAHALEVSTLAPNHRGLHRPEDLPVLRDAFVNYLQLCQKNGVRPGNIGAASAMGVHYTTIGKWQNGSNGDEYREFANTVNQILATIREDMISDGKLNPVIGIFWQRNFDALRNDTESVQSFNVESDTQSLETLSEIRKKYGDLTKE